jgi:hypothetical protein
MYVIVDKIEKSHSKSIAVCEDENGKTFEIELEFLPNAKESDCFERLLNGTFLRRDDLRDERRKKNLQLQNRLFHKK